MAKVWSRVKKAQSLPGLQPPIMPNRNENFEKAKILLLGTMDIVLELENNGKEVYGNLDNAPCSTQEHHSISSRGIREEHNRLFGFKPNFKPFNSCNKLLNKLRRGK